ncbi:MAG: HAD-IG family 5'-nucleotidase [Actinomycetia bacterium]|nr:HAD-IG family 5'-nucleotidase [Actinomycetes bacterium]MCP4224516.1 HAD-IG family 5'-nucleotidase [Actinomycetes bacterium]MCP5032419.1 HAD-IG family 5'-nucleotidase [Actinomycetes bacterium]
MPSLPDIAVEIDRPRPERGVFVNRTLNMRGIQAVGYDMDYTLIHYRVDEWEGAAFREARDLLGARGWPIGGLDFDPDRFTLGLAFDLHLGNVVKATRFGYVRRAQHGIRVLPFEEQRKQYRETIVELSEPRFEFMNTMFELSRADLFTQFVAIHDDTPLPGVTSYADLYWQVDDALSETHLTGTLKAEIVADPDRFVDLDPEIVAALVDQRGAGKQLVLITNSDWAYSRQMMAYALDRYCPDNTTWRDLFDLVIVSANKPRFFAHTDPLYHVVDEDRSLLRPHYGPLESGQVYFGGNARLVEQSLGLRAGLPLYVGDHLFGDVHVTKDVLRWRTALIARELEAEILDAIAFDAKQEQLEVLMHEKVGLERSQAQLRLDRQRGRPDRDRRDVSEALAAISGRLGALDDQIAPLAQGASELGNSSWGPLMRAGNDKSLFARQVERYADVYTSRASNLRYETPFGYLRAARGSLPHDLASEID